MRICRWCGSGGERGVSGVGVVERDESLRKLNARGRAREWGVGGEGVAGSSPALKSEDTVLCTRRCALGEGFFAN